MQEKRARDQRQIAAVIKFKIKTKRVSMHSFLPHIKTWMALALEIDRK